MLSAVTRSTLTAVPELDLVPGDGRAAAEAGDLRVDVELLEHAGQRLDHAVVGGAARLGAAARRQQLGRRQRVGDVAGRARAARPAAAAGWSAAAPAVRRQRHLGSPAWRRDGPPPGAAAAMPAAGGTPDAAVAASASVRPGRRGLHRRGGRSEAPSSRPPSARTDRHVRRPLAGRRAAARCRPGCRAGRACRAASASPGSRRRVAGEPVVQAAQPLRDGVHGVAVTTSRPKKPSSTSSGTATQAARRCPAARRPGSRPCRRASRIASAPSGGVGNPAAR